MTVRHFGFEIIAVVDETRIVETVRRPLFGQLIYTSGNALGLC